MRGHILTLTICAAASAIVGWLLAFTFGMPLPSIAPPFFLICLLIIGFGAAAALGAYVLWLALWVREPEPIPRVIAQVRGRTSPDYLARRILPLVLTFLFISSFSTFKVLIPRIQPFYLDGFLSDLDRWTFGTDPWRLTHAFIGPFGTRVLDISYGLWFPAWVLAILHFSLFAEKRLQRQFFLSFFAIWGILGIVLATVFSSAGPCFLELIHHPYADRYRGLFPIQNAPGAAKAQLFLARAYLSGDLGLAKGISAMPSVHIGIAAILVLALREYNRVILAAAVALYLLIFIASVHLGWHYFWDGGAATLGAIVIWKLAERPRRGVAQPALPVAAGAGPQECGTLS